MYYFRYICLCAYCVVFCVYGSVLCVTVRDTRRSVVWWNIISNWFITQTKKLPSMLARFVGRINGGWSRGPVARPRQPSGVWETHTYTLSNWHIYAEDDTNTSSVKTFFVDSPCLKLIFYVFGNCVQRQVLMVWSGGFSSRSFTYFQHIYGSLLIFNVAIVLCVFRWNRFVVCGAPDDNIYVLFWLLAGP